MQPGRPPVPAKAGDDATAKVQLGLAAARDLATAALVANQTSAANARAVAGALVAADADGKTGHGLSRLPAYAAQARAGKVDGFAQPTCARVRPGLVKVDARGGFAFPALDLAIAELTKLAAETGIALAAIGRSHHFGVGGHHVERLAEAGLIGLIFGNSPGAIAPWGGSRPLFGTNPIACAVPRRNDSPLVIDLSLSKVARGRVMVAAQNGERVAEGWGFDSAGRPTTDPRAILAGGSMAPMGEAKGAALALMVEVLSAGLANAHFGVEASSLFNADGPPPNLGQTLLAIDPRPTAGAAFDDRIEFLVGAILAQPGTRLPGAGALAARRAAAVEGIAVPAALHRQLVGLADIP